MISLLEVFFLPLRASLCGVSQVSLGLLSIKRELDTFDRRESQDDEVGGKEEICIITLLSQYWELHQLLFCLGKAGFV